MLLDSPGLRHDEFRDYSKTKSGTIRKRSPGLSDDLVSNVIISGLQGRLEELGTIVIFCFI